MAVLMHEVSSSKPARVKVHANEKFRSLFELTSSKSELKLDSESGGSEADLVADALRLPRNIVEKSSWDVYLRMWLSALASGHAQKRVCMLHPARVACGLDSFSAVVQLSVVAVDGRVKIVHTFTEL